MMPGSTSNASNGHENRLKTDYIEFWAVERRKYRNLSLPSPPNIVKLHSMTLTALSIVCDV